MTLILTEAGDGIGFGHYTRCSALQNYFLEKQVDCEICLHLKGDFELSLTKGIYANWIEDKTVLKQYVNVHSVIVDSYLASEALFTWLNTLFATVIAIDDYNRIKYAASCIINPNVFAADIDYSNQVMSSIYGGASCVMLRKVFNQSIATLPRIRPIPKNIVITIGGSDYRNILPKLIDIVLHFFIPITVIAGHKKKQIELKEQFPQIEVLGLLSAVEIYQTFKRADIVIAACGQTLHELACMGKPTIGICLDIDQEPNQLFYSRHKFLEEIISYDDLSKLKTQISNLIDPDNRRRLASIGQSIIQDNGVKKIGDIIETNLL